MKSFRHPALGIMLVCLSGLATFAQNPATKEKEIQKALAYLDEVVNESAILKVVGNRVYVLCEAGQLLWERDETRARSYFQAAINQFMATPLPNEPHLETAHRLWQSRQTVRDQIIQKLAVHDSKLALDFMRASRVPLPESLAPMAGEGLDRQEAEFEMRLAIQVAENDPETSLQVAQEALKNSLNPQVIEIWSRLAKKDSRLAGKLTAEILAKLKSSDLVAQGDAQESLFSMINLLRRQSGGETKRDKEKPVPRLVLTSAETQQLMRELTDLLAAAVLRITPTQLLDIQQGHYARSLLSQTQAILSEIEKYSAARLQQVRAKLGQYDKAFYQDPSNRYPSEALANKSAREIVDLAATAPTGTKEYLYRQAVGKAIDDGDAAAARRILKENLTSAAREDELVQKIEKLERDQALQAGKLNEARTAAARLKTDEDRARALIDLAHQAGKKKDRKSQEQLLGEARALLGARFVNREQVEAQLALAAAYLSLDPDVGFEILDNCLERLDAVIAAIKVIADYERSLGLFDFDSWEGEMRLSGDDLRDEFLPLLPDFAKCDIERTASALRAMRIPEARLSYSLAAIKAVLK